MTKLALALFGTTLVTAACSASTPAPTTIGTQGGGVARGAALIYVDWGDHAVFEADCWAPDVGGCVNLRAKALAGGELVTPTARFRLTSERTEECGASGETAEVTGYAVIAGADDASPGVAVFPSDALVDLRRHEPGAADAAPWMRPALAIRATHDLASTDHARPFTAGEIVIDQVVTGNFTGTATPDLLIAATVPLSERDGPGYAWSALVLVPDGQRGAMTSLWVSDLEAMAIRASYDLDGDGVRAFVWTAEYYEGGAIGAGAIKGGQFEVARSVGCGA
ncbi:MAG: hypothetical protein IPL61_37935 [Myxococcales bacterium]|nr:hypothetical protein [Myxococcales bacterium]